MLNKIYLCFTAVFILVFSANAQHVVIGEKAPDIKVVEWDRNISPRSTSKAVLVDFFHSANNQCVSNLPILNSIQQKYTGRLNVLVLTKETGDKMAPLIMGKGYEFYVGYDGEGRTFSSYGIRFVPFAILIDSNGRVAWTGNVNALPDDIIRNALR